MYQHPAMLEILEEDRRREHYPDPREWWMYERHVNRLYRGPGLIARALTWAAGRLSRRGAAIQQALRASAHSHERVLREECETC
jgi:hypothetical protein